MLPVNDPIKAGLQVVMAEEGPLKSRSDFNQLESEAYPLLYQESAARKSCDKAINILQGRCVGGSTTVNWTSSFRTPASTLQFWQAQFGLKSYSVEALAPYFAQAEQRLNIAPWQMASNENNDLLRRGALKLGIPTAAIARNGKGCWNMGSCGLGCPTNPKQSMLVTTIPAVLDLGAQLLTQTRAERFELSNGKVTTLLCRAVATNGAAAQSEYSNGAIKIVVKHYVFTDGAINSPAGASVNDGGAICNRCPAGAPAARNGRALYFTAKGVRCSPGAAHEVASAQGGQRACDGGCGLAGVERLGVTRPDGVHWRLENLSIYDAPLFQTSTGANPQLSVYGVANRLAQGLLKRLAGRNAALA